MQNCFRVIPAIILNLRIGGSPHFKFVKLTDQPNVDVMLNFFSKVWYQNNSKTSLPFAMNIIIALLKTVWYTAYLIFVKQYTKYIQAVR